MPALLGLGLWGLIALGPPLGSEAIADARDVSLSHGAYSLTAPYIYQFPDAPYLLSHEMKIGGSLKTGFSGALYWYVWESKQSYAAHPDVADCTYFETLSGQIINPTGTLDLTVGPRQYKIRYNPPRASGACSTASRAFLFGTAQGEQGGHAQAAVESQLSLTTLTSDAHPFNEEWSNSGYTSALNARWSFGDLTFETLYMVGSASEAWPLPELLTPLTLEHPPQRSPGKALPEAP